MKLVYRVVFALTTLLLLTNVAFAQTGAATVNPYSTPKLIVFGITVVQSIILDLMIIGFLIGDFKPIRALVSSIPGAFLNVFWWDFIAPAVSGMPILTMKFMQIGNPEWNYWIGSNVIAVFIFGIVFSQLIFRFARGAQDLPMIWDIFWTIWDTMMPTILFIGLPMLGII